MKTIGEVLKLAATFLEERKSDSPRRTAEELLSKVLALKRLDLYMQFDRPVIESELVLFREFLKRKAKGEPLQYILGEVEFLGCKIKIDSRVLIPRQETEILTDSLVKRLKEKKLSGLCLWDICAGSGCVGIALKKALPDLSVILSDISPDVLALAKENARGNQIEVEFLLGDLLAPFAGRKADFVVCNPPYISESEFLTLDPSVKSYEPKGALVGGERGVEFYERLNRELPPFLNPKAQLFLEIGSGQEGVVKEIFSNSYWNSLEIRKDWAGHPRFFFLEKQ